jgi:hypothetical protein
MKEIKLPSGAILKITHTPFADSWAFNEAVLEEVKALNINSKTDVMEIYKSVLCVGFSSPKIKSALWKCFERCTYNSGKGEFRITQDTFEPEEARQDYTQVCIEVAKYNIGPFVKAHSSLFNQAQEILKNSQLSKPQTTPS